MVSFFSNSFLTSFINKINTIDFYDILHRLNRHILLCKKVNSEIYAFYKIQLFCCHTSHLFTGYWFGTMSQNMFLPAEHLNNPLSFFPNSLRYIIHIFDSDLVKNSCCVCREFFLLFLIIEFDIPNLSQIYFCLPEIFKTNV